MFLSDTKLQVLSIVNMQKRAAGHLSDLPEPLLVLFGCPEANGMNHRAGGTGFANGLNLHIEGLAGGFGQIKSIAQEIDDLDGPAAPVPKLHGPLEGLDGIGLTAEMDTVNQRNGFGLGLTGGGRQGARAGFQQRIAVHEEYHAKRLGIKQGGDAVFQLTLNHTEPAVHAAGAIDHEADILCGSFVAKQGGILPRTDGHGFGSRIGFGRCLNRRLNRLGFPGCFFRLWFWHRRFNLGFFGNQGLFDNLLDLLNRYGAEGSIGCLGRLQVHCGKCAQQQQVCYDRPPCCCGTDFCPPFCHRFTHERKRPDPPAISANHSYFIAQQHRAAQWVAKLLNNHNFRDAGFQQIIDFDDIAVKQTDTAPRGPGADGFGFFGAVDRKSRAAFGGTFQTFQGDPA